jgi:predicted DNA-binding transcriptional regulator AlpA
MIWGMKDTYPASDAPPDRASPEPPVLLTLAMVRRHYLPLGQRTLFRMIATGTFPRADVRLGGKTRLWRRETVERWIDANSAGGAVGGRR